MDSRKKSIQLKNCNTKPRLSNEYGNGSSLVPAGRHSAQSTSDSELSGFAKRYESQGSSRKSSKATASFDRTSSAKWQVTPSSNASSLMPAGCHSAQSSSDSELSAFAKGYESKGSSRKSSKATSSKGHSSFANSSGIWQVTPSSNASSSLPAGYYSAQSRSESELSRFAEKYVPNRFSKQSSKVNHQSQIFCGIAEGPGHGIKNSPFLPNVGNFGSGIQQNFNKSLKKISPPVGTHGATSSLQSSSSVNQMYGGMKRATEHGCKDSPHLLSVDNSADVNQQKPRSRKGIYIPSNARF